LSKVRADERSVGNETYGFDAIRGIQAGREFYVAMCPFKTIPKLFIFNDEFVPPEMRAQRILRNTRIPALKNYIINNTKDYIFSSLTASVDGVMKFSPSPSEGQDGKIGRLYISMDATILINDGQHRRRAIEQALKEMPDLGHEMISVVFFQDKGLKRSQQMFADLNKNAIKPTKSLNILYDHRDNFSQFIVRLINSVEIFQGRVELEKTAISNRSKTFFTLSGIADSTMTLLGINKGRKITEEESWNVKEYWNEVSKNIPEWQLLIQGKVTSAELRKNYVNAHTNLLNALGIVGNVLINEYPKNWKEKIRGLQKIDWSRNNIEWEGRLLQKGRMLKNRLGVELAVNTILENCGVKLSEERLEFEKRK
jgi:DNA sulfur modification protein DndB